jgi:hypothetical protein
MEMHDTLENNSLMEPPKYDMLNIKFRGDQFEIYLPYCEVANGIIADVQPDTISISVDMEDGKSHKEEFVSLSYDEFTSVMEKTFDTKQIVKLSVQRAGTHQLIKIL